jgi:hypothetical protein
MRQRSLLLDDAGDLRGTADQHVRDAVMTVPLCLPGRHPQRTISYGREEAGCPSQAAAQVRDLH